MSGFGATSAVAAAVAALGFAMASPALASTALANPTPANPTPATAAPASPALASSTMPGSTTARSAADNVTADSVAAGGCRWDFTATGANLRAQPNTGARVLGQGNPGDCIDVHRAAYGGTATCPGGAKDNYWYDVTNLRTGVRGWVSHCLVPPNTPSHT